MDGSINLDEILIYKNKAFKTMFGLNQNNTGL